jgi:integrase
MGVHPSVVQQLLGHSRVGVTLDTYSHVMPAMLREAAKQMDDVLGGRR